MSIFKETYILKAGTVFRNVSGSSLDFLPLIPFPPGSRYSNWLDLWTNKTSSSASQCSVSGCSGTDLIGGHIVLGGGSSFGAASHKAKDLEGGNRVFIVPICKSCNAQSRDLSLAGNILAVHLAGFLFDEDVEGSCRKSFECKYTIGDEADYQEPDIQRAWEITWQCHQQQCNDFLSAAIDPFDYGFTTLGTSMRLTRSGRSYPYQ